jgi:HEPN domain-containing protein
MERQEKINFWRESAKRDFDVVETLLKSNKYSQALFFLHLAIEKMIKGLVLKSTGESPLPIHNLERLANDASVEIDEEMKLQLREINSYNISARYDSCKLEFYKKATREYTLKWFEIGKKLFQFFQQKYE